MANTFGQGVYNEEFWAAEMQDVFQRENVALAIANTELRSYLNKGDTIHKAYGTYPTVTSYTKGTAITVPDYSGTDESLVVDTAQVAPMYIDDIKLFVSLYSNIQNKFLKLLENLVRSFILAYKAVKIERIETISSQA